MIKAVLLDLDNTLLHNPDGPFAVAFRQLFDDHFHAELGIEQASDGLRAGIRSISDRREDFSTNAHTIVKCLSQRYSLQESKISLALADFYSRPYKTLEALTEPVAAAPSLISSLLNQDILVAIATNPLYPESAILDRLEWAGLSARIGDFAFITHSENTHSAKPNPAYYAEVVARVGVEPDETLMIGDSAINDIQPATAIGIHSWHVACLAEVDTIAERVKSAGWQDNFLQPELDPGAIFPQYLGNIAALHGLLADVKTNQWLQRPDPNEWSIVQILCHLWKAETDVHQNRLRAILDQDNPFLASLAPPGPDIAPCHNEGFAILARFWRARLTTMEILGSLQPSDWDRPARHSIFGLTNLLEMAYFTAQHDRLHITQLCQTLGKCAE